MDNPCWSHRKETESIPTGPLPKRTEYVVSWLTHWIRRTKCRNAGHSWPSFRRLFLRCI